MKRRVDVEAVKAARKRGPEYWREAAERARRLPAPVVRASRGVCGPAAASRCDEDGVEAHETTRPTLELGHARVLFLCGARVLVRLRHRLGIPCRALVRHDFPCPRCEPKAKVPRGFRIVKIERGTT